MTKYEELSVLGRRELDLLGSYLHRGKLTQQWPRVRVHINGLQGNWHADMPLLISLQKGYGHLCVFHSGCFLTLESDDTIRFDLGVHQYTSTDFNTICANIDASYEGFCYISYALVAVCQREALIDIGFVS